MPKKRTASVTGRLEIRKYPNRRYYDTTHSRHLTLEEMRTLVQQGHDIRVVDSQSGADITPLVLTQILLDLETDKLAMFPADFLTRLIRLNDHLFRDYVHKYLGQSMISFIEFQRRMGEQVLPSLGGGVGPWSPMMWQGWPGGGPGTGGETGAAAEAPAETPEEGNLRDRIQQLEEQLAEMRAALGTATPKRAGRPPRRRPPGKK